MMPSASTRWVLRLLLSVLGIVSLIGGVSGAVAADNPSKRTSKANSTQNPSPAPKLTLEGIARDPAKWIGSISSQVRWTEDRKKLHFLWRADASGRPELYEVTVDEAGSKPRKVPDDEKRWLSSNPGDRNRAGTLKVYSYQGDVYLHDLQTGKTRQITRTAENETDPRFTWDGQSIVFTRGENLFEWVVATGEISQVTDFRRGKDPDATPELSAYAAWLEKQQLDLFEVIRRQREEEKDRKEQVKRERGPFPAPHYLKETESVANFQLSPDGNYVTFVLNDRTDAAKAKIVDMPKYVTKSGYAEMERLESQTGSGGRLKVGDSQPAQKLGVMNTADGKISYFDMGFGKREYVLQLILNPNFPPLFGSQDIVWRNEYALNYTPGAGASAVAWSDDGKSAFCVLRSRDNKDRWIVLLDPATVTARILDAEHEDSWVLAGGPYGWLDDQTIWFRSERDGFFHIYTLSIRDGKVRALTAGDWEVTFAQLSRDRTTFYLTTNRSHPGERHLYSLSVSGGDLVPLTSGEGVNAGVFSPDERLIAVRHSTPDFPDELYLMDNKAGAQLRRLTDSYTDEFKNYRWAKFQVVAIPDADKHLVYARLYKPERPDPLHAAVIYVHGGGFQQNVFKDWGNFGLTPFFNVLVQAGFYVLDLDYRGSSGYGRQCRATIYRNMGGKDVDSAVAAAKWLSDTHGVDPRRIGIYGGSYGGFFTLMALFKHPGVFAAGVALRPVADWAHYNPSYTSNILNLPYKDEEAYQNSSPIYHVSALQDRLLIIHGLQDRNVHYQDTIRLIQRLIEAKKAGWELATMPVEDHGFWKNESSRLDSYRRKFKLFEEVLKRPLPRLRKWGPNVSSSQRSVAGGNH